MRMSTSRQTGVTKAGGAEQAACSQCSRGRALESTFQLLRARPGEAEYVGPGYAGRRL